MVVRTVDRVGKAGVSPPLGPAPSHGGRGRNGVIVRYLTARAPIAPVAAGAPATVAVDAAVGGRYDWVLTRPGARRPPARGKGSGPALRVPVPRPAPGIAVL